MARRILNFLEQQAAERPVFLAFLVFLTAAAAVIPLSFPFYFLYPQEFLVNILSEAHGMVFDLLIIGWFLFWLNKLADRRLTSNRYREEIEDFLGWQSPEATHRIAGNIRRLNRIGVKEGIRLTEAHLKGANLGGAGLRKSDLWGADLEGANLAGADLRQASLAGASLEGANLERATLARADLRGANLIEADLERADLTGCDLGGALLQGADLQYAILEEAGLERVNLAGANLRGVNLKKSRLPRTDLTGAGLRGAVLDGADLLGATLAEADLGGASFLGAALPRGEALREMFRPVKNLLGARFDPEAQILLEEAFPEAFSILLYPGDPGQGGSAKSGDGARGQPTVK